jgi:hypothetical protein
MTLFSMQVACACDMMGVPVGMDTVGAWDGDDIDGGFVEGRRYIWKCPACGHQVCVNFQELGD